MCLEHALLLPRLTQHQILCVLRINEFLIYRRQNVLSGR